MDYFRLYENNLNLCSNNVSKTRSCSPRALWKFIKWLWPVTFFMVNYKTLPKNPHKNQTKKPPKFKVFDFLILDNLSQSQETLFGHSNLFFFWYIVYASFIHQTVVNVVRTPLWQSLSYTLAKKDLVDL